MQLSEFGQSQVEINKALYDIISLSLEDDGLDETLDKILKVLIQQEWLSLEKKGCIFLVSEKDEKLNLAASFNFDDDLRKMCTQIAYGQCLCGQAAVSKKVLFKSCVDEAHHIRLAHMQPHGHYIIPVLHGNKMLAVVNLYIKHGHKQREDEVEFLQACANTVAGVIRRKIAEQKLQTLNAQLEYEILKQINEVRSLARFPQENPSPVMRISQDNQLIYANQSSSYFLQHSGFCLGEVIPLRYSKDFECVRQTGQITECQFHVGERWYSLVVSPLANSGGELNLYGKNITERILIEYDLAKLASVVEQAEEIVIVTDAQGLIQYVNPAFERVSGYAPEEVLGKSPSIVKSGEHDDAYYQDMWATLKKGHAWYGDFINRTKDGSLYEIIQTISPVRNNLGEITGYSAVQHNITEQRKAERKVQHADRVDSLGVLAGGIAHDFNNLLTTILCNVSLAKKKSEALSGLLHCLDSIESASESAALLCQQMLAYSGKGQFEVRPIYLSEQVKNMMQLLEVSLPKSISLVYDLKGDLPAVNADLAQIQQVILNLIINASEAIGENYGQVCVTTAVVYADENYLSQCVGDSHITPGLFVCLKVTDNGCGMSPEIQGKIFDPFFTTKFTGRGLGMSAMLGIVKSHHGGLFIHSVQGKGTEIDVILPIFQAYIVKEEGEKVDEEWRGSGVVLVVDDEEALLEISKLILEDVGFDVLTACDGEQGLAVFIEHRQDISLVLLDMTMPKMDGLECLEALQSIDENIRVLLVSGYSKDEMSQKFLHRGVAGFVHKPYTPKELVSQVSQLMEK